jgi:hypothetical protein
MISRMGTPGTGRCTAWLLLALACALPAAAAGAEPETERWVPALAVFGEVLAQQPEETRESTADLSASRDDLRVLALVGATDGLITLLVPEQETGHWVAEIAVPGEAHLQQAGGADQGAILPGVSGEVLVASPVAVATAEPVMPAATPAPDEIVEPIPPGQPGGTGSPPEAAARERKPKDETERWVPAFSIYSGVLVQGAQGTIDTGPILGTENTPDGGVPGKCVPPPNSPDTKDHCNRQIRPTFLVLQDEEIPPLESVTTRGDDLMVTPFVGGSLELMTPGLTSLPGRPRLFVHGDAAASFAPTRDVAKEGSPDEFEVSPKVEKPSELAVEGQGSKTTVDIKPLLISAGAGVAFTVDARERRLRIKPSVEYLREEIEVTGVVHRAMQTGIPPIPPPEDFPEGFRLIELSGGKKQVFHGVGPGLEIEADTARAGPLMLTLYLAGQAYAFLGDLEMEFSDTNEDGETATWRFEKNRWGFRAGVGLRFRWVPE